MSEHGDRMRALGRHFRETWHEGVTLAAGHVVIRAWEVLGLPGAVRLAARSCRAAWEFALLLYFAV